MNMKVLFLPLLLGVVIVGYLSINGAQIKPFNDLSQTALGVEQDSAVTPDESVVGAMVKRARAQHQHALANLKLAQLAFADIEVSVTNLELQVAAQDQSNADPVGFQDEIKGSFEKIFADYQKAEARLAVAEIAEKEALALLQQELAR